jgi:excisionase family DNA binding protein
MPDDLLANAPELMTVAAVARELSSSPRQVWRLIHDGELATVKIGARGTRVLRTSLVSYLQRMADRQDG